VRLLWGLRRIHVHLLLALLALLLARPSQRANVAGTMLVALGLALRIWAAGVLEKGGELCTDGPYRCVRHPLYLGSLIAAVGFSVMVNVLWASLLFLVIFIIVYAAQALAEEQHLRVRFGHMHLDYARRVPMMIPRLPTPRLQGRTWQLRRVLVNREHYHLLVTCLLVLLFYARPYWPPRY